MYKGEVAVVGPMSPSQLPLRCLDDAPVDVVRARFAHNHDLHFLTSSHNGMQVNAPMATPSVELGLLFLLLLDWPADPRDGTQRDVDPPLVL